MECKFVWYNLPNSIRKAIEPFNEQLTTDVKNINWFNMLSKINKLYDELSTINPDCAIPFNKFIWCNLPTQLKLLCDLINCEQEDGGK